MENIKIELNHISINQPLVKFIVDGKIYENLQIKNNDPIIIDCTLDDGNHVIEIQHYGKNYFTDDKSFELKKIKINDIDLNYEIFQFVQYPDLPPWENWHNDLEPIAWKNNLHLGHNGKIVYNNFSTPSVEWFKKTFVNTYQPASMQSSKQILETAKDFFNKKIKESN